MVDTNLGIEPAFNRYTNPIDLVTNNNILRERALSQYYRIQYYREITPVSNLDDMRLEVEESQRVFADPVVLYMLIKREKQEDLFTKYGLDVNIDLRVYIPTVILEDNRLVTVNPSSLYSCTTSCRPGDYFIFNSIRYDVIYCDHLSVFWASTNYPQFFYIVAKRYRDDFGGLVSGLYNTKNAKQ